MKIIETVNVWQALQRDMPCEQSIGFVPTMGCLHEAHLNLLRQSVQENDITVLSIFVNPIQFNDQSDYAHYPRTEEEDMRLAASIGVDYLFRPSVEAMYPSGQDYMQIQTTSPISQIMEGEFRPGHFDGMLTIVLKLLLLVQPTRAYFGEKDYQQLQLVKELVKNFFLSCEIIGCPIVRESSGLAMSSRNRRLTDGAHSIAEKMAAIFQQYGELSRGDVLTALNELGVTVEYLQEFQGRAYLAAKVGGIRLIDNIKLPG